MKTKDKVERILRDYPATRNSDRELRKQYGKVYYGLTDEQVSVFDTFKEDFETIRRNRQKIQEEGLYKADKKVKVFREVRRAEVEVEMGYHPTQAIGQRMHEQKAAEKKQEKLFNLPWGRS
jgi:pyruvate-formate lyase